MGAVCSSLPPCQPTRPGQPSDRIDAAVELWNAKNPRDNAQGIYILAVLSTHDDVRAELFDTPGVVNALVTAAREGETSDVRENAVIALANLVDESDEKRVLLFNWKGVVETLLRNAKSGKTDRLRVNALRALVSLVYVEEHKEKVLVEWSDIVDAFRDAVISGVTPEIQGYGVTGIVNLLMSPSARVAMLAWPGILEALRLAASTGSTETIREQGLNGLVILAHFEENQVPLFECKGVVEIMLNSAEAGKTQEIIVRGFVGLTYLARPVTNKPRILEREGVLEVILAAMRNGSTDEVRFFAGSALVALIHDTTASRLISRSDIVELLIDITMNGRTSDVRKVSLMAMNGLIEHRDFAQKLIEEWSCLRWLKLMDEKLDAEVAAIYLNLSTSSFGRSATLEDVSVLIHIEEIIVRTTCERTRMVAKLVRAILRGSDAKYHSLDPLDFKRLAQLLESSVRGTEFLGTKWHLRVPLVAIRFLATVDRHRDMLGTEVLPLLRCVVCDSVNSADWYASEMAITTLAQYALDTKTLPVLAADPAYQECLENVGSDSALDGPWSEAVRIARLTLTALKLDTKPHSLTLADTRSGQVMISQASPNVPGSSARILGRDVAEFLLRKGFSAVWCDEKASTADIVQKIAASEVVVVLLDKHYMESVACKFQMKVAVQATRKIIPMLVQPGYDHRGDDWLGRFVSSIPFYDISSLPKKASQLAMLHRNELYSTRLDVQLDFSKNGYSGPLKRSSNSLGLPGTAEEIEAWAARAGIPQQVTQAIIQGGYVTSELLEGLSSEPSSEIQKLLHLDLPAHATQLRRELQMLFQPCPTAASVGRSLLLSEPD